MVIKPSISFLTNDSDPQLIVDTQTILTSMTGNPGYTTPDPTLAAVTTAMNDFATALANAADGGATLTAIKNDKRAALVGLLRNLANYVQVACNGDLTVLMSSGFPIQKPQRSPIGVLPAPTGLTLDWGICRGSCMRWCRPCSARPFITGA
jgi:hypothetical protein